MFRLNFHPEADSDAHYHAPKLLSAMRYFSIAQVVGNTETFRSLSHISKVVDLPSPPYPLTHADTPLEGR